MSNENINLEEMVEQTLENTGILPKMRVSHIVSLWLTLNVMYNAIVIFYSIG